ncbi:MAG: hypothetical protein DMG91_13975 [Acidobacteria bacterium]|nr:MAG: hypothetical protein DMG91_13975 [Acidobacteriota bacterium]
MEVLMRPVVAAARTSTVQAGTAAPRSSTRMQPTEQAVGQRKSPSPEATKAAGKMPNSTQPGAALAADAIANAK